MAHPTFWPHKTFFYPIGNTSPIQLTQFLAPKEDASVLLLGCGDPRNILYTLHTSAANTDSRCFDFTCIDIEGAVLARNAILLTLVVDDSFPGNMSQVWNIFYHFFLDKDSFELLINHCRKLLELSQDMEAWYSGPYSRFLRISSSFTLSEMRKYWAAYTETSTSRSFKKRYVAEMKEAAKKIVGADSAIRSAGPLLGESPNSLRALSTHFWKTGIIHADRMAIASATYVNPTFGHSIQGSGFMAHYATMPASTFHLAPAFASMKSMPPKPVGQQIISTMMDQFQNWCMTFRGTVVRETTDKPRIVIRLLVGDAFSSCYTLQNYASEGRTTAHHRVSAWRAEALVLNLSDYGPDALNPAPRTFNVIDTSNLSDHLGIVNIIVATSPLLTQSPTSSINTETHLGHGGDALIAFTKHIFGDIATISLLLDLTPSSFVSGFTSDSNAHNVILHRISNSSGQFLERIFWKIPSLMERKVDEQGPTLLSFEPEPLARLLFGIYLKMFRFEDFSSKFGKMSLEGARELGIVHYDRLSFALLLQAIKQRTRVDWEETFSIMLGIIRDDKSLVVGSNQYHDLVAQLDALGIYSATHFYPFDGMLDDAKKAHLTVPRFRNWNNVPPLIYLSLIVPRDKLRVLDQNYEGNPNLIVTIRSRTMNALNSFVIIQSALGSIVQGDSSDTAILRADPNGSVVVTFRVPVSTLVLTVGAEITLNVQSTVGTTPLIPHLGMFLEIYSVLLEDTKRVWVTRYPPQCETQTPGPMHYAFNRNPDGNTDAPVVFTSLSPDADRVTSFTLRQYITDSKAKALLGDRATEVKATQVTPCGIMLSIGATIRVPITYPFPVEGSKAKLRIARQSSYIETIVPIARPSSTEGMALGRFPLISHNRHYVPWNLHRINFERLPLLDFELDRKPQWASTHVSLAFSDKERNARESSTPHDPSLDLLNLKDPLCTAFLTAFGDSEIPSPHPTLALHCTESGGSDTVFFVTGIRLDLSAHTVVADAYVLPLNMALARTLVDGLDSIMPTTTQIVISPRAVVAWKKALPAMVERCRNWDHKKDCQYMKTGNIPLSTKHSEIPICECGQGQDSETFLKVRIPEWEAFAPYVTRIALSPLFAVPYLESVANFQKFRSITDALRCAKCGNERAKLLVCSRCKSAAYCSRECQTADWKQHKPACVA